MGNDHKRRALQDHHQRHKGEVSLNHLQHQLLYHLHRPRRPRRPRPPPAPPALPPPRVLRNAPPRPDAAAESSSLSSVVNSSGVSSQRSLKRLMKEYNNLNALESQQGGCRKVCDLFSKCGSSVACDALHAPRSSQPLPLQLHFFEANPRRLRPLHMGPTAVRF